MKRQQSAQNDIVNPHSFHNPTSQQTFDSLPKIYGSIKNKILHKKLHFYEQLYKQSPQHRKSKGRYTPAQEAEVSPKINKQKRKKEVPSEELKELQKINTSSMKNPSRFSDKFNKLKLTKRDLGSSTKRLVTTTEDSQSRHKVKFNTLHFLPGINNLGQKKGKPETLSEIIQEKIANSINISSPLVHLYKTRRHNIKDSFIRIQTKEDSSHAIGRESTMEKYVPKEIQKSMKNRKQTDGSDSQHQSRMKTQPSPDRAFSFSSHNNTSGAMTEFSKRLMNSTSYREIDIGMGTSTKFRIPTKDEYKQFIQGYKSSHPGFNLKSILEKETFEIVSYGNAVYFGQFKEGKQGIGLLITEDFIFEGFFDKDSKVKGVEINYDGVYTGKFLNNQRQGKGKFEWNNGEVYEGNWHEGKKHGFGVWKSPNGDYYEGQWSKGRQQGNGVHKHKISTYRGQFLGSLKHGNGQEIFANGDKYKGMYSMGKPHGTGRYEWSDGSYYEGDFEQGYREGKGELREKTGTYYKVSKGSFKRDFKHGFGQEIQKSGEKFVGQFEEGYRVYSQSVKH